MKICLNLKPISVNQMYYGDHIKTKLCRQYDRALDLLLSTFKKDIILSEWYVVKYFFYLVNFERTDIDNLLKGLSDGLVRNGFLIDDRRVKQIYIEKFKSDKDSIGVEILPYTEEKQ